MAAPDNFGCLSGTPSVFSADGGARRFWLAALVGG